MKTIKPSEGVIYSRQTVFVEGEIAGSKARSAAHGGRWVVKIRDTGSVANAPMATLAVNENPDQNPAVCAMGVGKPNEGVLQLFRDEEFESLFQIGRTFRAEAIVGVVDGMAWFNVWQIILFEPQFKIGTRQVSKDPTCERRLLLQTRGTKGLRRSEERNLGGIFVGDLVHSTFQEMVTSERRTELFDEFQENPREFLLRSIQPDALLTGALGQLGEPQRLYGSEWSTAKNQIIKLIESASVREQIEESTQWDAEVPVSSNSIHGDIDLRTGNIILELKSGLLRRSYNDQVYVYIVGEMLQHGFAVKDQRKGILITSSTRPQVNEDNRVTILQEDDHLMDIFRRFLLARHRLLLTSSGEKLPKIEYNPDYCEGESCPYYLQKDDSGGCACHFYCQTDRNWSCDECKHTSICTEHSKYHSFEVLDESNRIREALRREIELLRNEDQTYAEWNNTFRITQVGDRRLLTVSNPEGFSVDPPKPGEKILIHAEGKEYPVSGQMCGLDEKDNWVIINRGPSRGQVNSTLSLSQPKSELNGIYHLQGCLDDLQRLGQVSNREGISFAGGSIVSGRPEIVNNLTGVISARHVTDIFCQSFSVRKSKKLLQEITQSVEERLLIVTDAVTPSLEGSVDLRGEQLLNQVADSRSISDALTRVKETLERHPTWVISPDMLLNTDIFNALPREGRNYFEQTILYEANNVTGLEYFLIRKFSKRILVIGDGNCVGRPLRSEESIRLGLGDNLMARVYNRGFPKIEGRLEPRIVQYEDQQIDLQLNRGLDSCRMIQSPCAVEESRIQLIPCELGEEPIIQAKLIHSCTRKIPDAQRKELRLKMASPCSPNEIENDLREFLNLGKIVPGLVGGHSLLAPTSGREYVVETAPINPSDEGKDWVFKFYGQGKATACNDQEASKIIAKIKKLLANGVKGKNLAVMSTNTAQLGLIAKQFGDELKGGALRTPYGICGESWGHVVVSCSTQSAGEISPSELYTMIRASHDKTYIFGTAAFFKNHPLLRNLFR